jgi:hypothetical protein
LLNDGGQPDEDADAGEDRASGGGSQDHALGGGYIQLDAPNYAQWHVDSENRAAFETWGHNVAAELVADAEIDSALFEGINGVTRDIHLCRGNAPGGRWLANGGYDRIASEVFPRLSNFDRLLLEYDTPRAAISGRCGQYARGRRWCWG